MVNCNNCKNNVGIAHANWGRGKEAPETYRCKHYRKQMNLNEMGTERDCKGFIKK